MELSNVAAFQFAKTVNDKNKGKTESTVYGTIVIYGGEKYVKMDGSDYLTPCDSTVSANEGERVTVLVKNHTATVNGNLSSPAARTGDVEDVKQQVLVIEQVVADKANIKDLEAERARIGELVADNAVIKGRVSASEADIGDLKADNAKITGRLDANEASIKKLDAEKLTAKDAELKYATVEKLQATDAKVGNLETDNVSVKGRLDAAEGNIKNLNAEKLNATNADLKYATIESLKATDAKVGDLEADNVTINQHLSANDADIKSLRAEKLNAKDADIKYANIDFSNIGIAAMEKFYSESGLIKNVVVGNQTITGELVGVTIKGDLIEGNTLKADKLVIKGKDGLYYKLNTDGTGVTSEQTDENSLNGTVIQAKSITADKVAVTDLVAFGADIGGNHVGHDCIYSGAKTSALNTTRGFYLGSDGQVGFGDTNEYIQFYKGDDGAFHLRISAGDIVFGKSKQTIESAINNIDTKINNVKSIIDTIYTYQVGTNMTDTPTGEWLSVMPNVPQGQYLWTKETTLYSDGTTSVGYIATRMGVDGAGGATGPAGPQGPQGEKGEKGDTGEQGPQGNQGIQGEKGATGATGAQGPQGDKGDTGAQGPQGNQGIAGTDGKKIVVAPVSYNGLDYYNGYDESSINYKITNRIADNFAVSNSEGINVGDIALCKCVTVDTLRTTYMMLQITSIPSSTHIVGIPIGQTTGLNGATGAQGPQGEKGDTGAQGPQGNQGVPGVKGDTGAAGNGIASTVIEYQAGSSSTAVPNGTWSKTPVTTTAANPYFWTKTTINYTNGAVSVSYNVGATPEGIEVGGRNLLPGSHKNPITYSYPGSDYTDRWSCVTTIPLNGDTYTLSFWAKSTVAGDMIRVHFYNPTNITHVKGSQGQEGSQSDGLCDFVLSTTLTKYWVTYTIPKGGDSTRNIIIPRIGPYVGVNGSGIITIQWEKLEEGNKATDWTPAPEDVDAAVDAANNKANAANSTAGSALSTANSANSTANSASSKADAANSKADTANNTANAANSKADTANSTANAANSTAQKAQATADMGLNKWLIQQYPTSANIRSAEDLIKSKLKAVGCYEFLDANLNASYMGSILSDYYSAYCYTYCSFSADTTVSTTFISDDDGALYLNGELVLLSTSCTSNAVTLNFKKGWNILEVVYHEVGGGDGFQFGTTISSNANCIRMDCYADSYIGAKALELTTSGMAVDAKSVADSADASIANWCYNNDRTYINGGKLYAGSVTAVQMAANAITSEKIASEAISTDKLAANAVTAAKINVTDLFAQDITASGTIRGVTLVSADIIAKRIIATKEFSLSTSSADVERVLYYDGKSVRVGKLSNAASAQNGAGFEFFPTTITAYGNLNMYSGDITTPGSITATKTITANGSITAGTFYTPNWFRSRGQTGWFNETYGGGIWMSDSDWVRVYNGKSFSVDGFINCGYEYISNKGSREWRFGSACGTGDQNWFGFYDTSSGYHGGIYGPDHILRMNGEIQSMYPNAFRAIYGSYGFIMRNDGANFYFMPTNANDAYGGWNDNYSYVSLATGQWTLKDDKGHRLYPVLTATTDNYRITSLQRSNNNLRFNSPDGVARYCTGTTSDIRLKKNIDDVEVKDALSVINSIQLRSFDWKESGEHQRIGFVADELEQLDPKFAVGGGVTEDGGIDTKVVDTFYLLGYVVKAMQELSSEVKQLKKENEELKRKLYS